MSKLQRNKEWDNARLGKFTASRIHEILTDKKRPMTENEMNEHMINNPKSRVKTILDVGDMCYTYAREKAVEELYGKEQNTIITKDMQRGIDQEPMAIDFFARKNTFYNIGLCGFIPYKEIAGCSPDAVIYNTEDEIISGIEVKCPTRQNFFKIVTKGIDAVKKEYFAQVQMQMLVTDTKSWNFFNYYICENTNQELGHNIVIKRCEETIAKIKKRLPLADAYKKHYIQQIKINTLKND